MERERFEYILKTAVAGAINGATDSRMALHENGSIDAPDVCFFVFDYLWVSR
jgi:hypothetical protein